MRSRFIPHEFVSVLAISASLAVFQTGCALAGGACCAVPVAAAAKSTESTPDSIVVLDISGMTCDGCADHVQKVLAGVKGVKEAKVAYSTREATVRLTKPTAKTKELVHAVKKAGYGAQVKVKRGGKPSQAESKSSS
jgi:copper chaperone CopZ